MTASGVSLTDLCDLCDLLSDATRVRIVLLLAKEERNVTGICEEFKKNQPIISHHLGLLRMNRLIVGKRKGKEVIYSLAPHIKVAGGKVKIVLPPYSVTLEGAWSGSTCPPCRFPLCLHGSQ